MASPERNMATGYPRYISATVTSRALMPYESPPQAISTVMSAGQSFC